MGLYDRSWYRDEVRKNGSIDRKRNCNTVIRHGSWILIALSLFAAYLLSPSFQSKIGILWTNIKTTYFTDVQDKETPSAIPSHNPQQTIPNPLIRQPEVTPWPHQEPWYQRQPNTIHTSILERKEILRSVPVLGDVESFANSRHTVESRG